MAGLRTCCFITFESLSFRHLWYVSVFIYDPGTSVARVVSLDEVLSNDIYRRIDELRASRTCLLSKVIHTIVFIRSSELHERRRTKYVFGIPLRISIQGAKRNEVAGD